MNKRPVHCGKTCEIFRKIYGKPGTYCLSPDGIKWVAWSVIVGFRCRVCGQPYIPYETEWDNYYMESLPAVRLEGLAFDATLTHA